MHMHGFLEQPRVRYPQSEMRDYGGIMKRNMRLTYGIIVRVEGLPNSFAAAVELDTGGPRQKKDMLRQIVMISSISALREKMIGFRGAAEFRPRAWGVSRLSG